MLAIAGLAILHGSIAAIFIESLMRAWRVEEPGLRLAMRVVALVAPFVFPAGFAWAAPFRSSEAFHLQWAWYAGASWDVLRIGTIPASAIATSALAVTGLGLYLRDAIPFLADRIAAPGHDPVVAQGHPAYARLRAAMSALPSTSRDITPRVRVIADSGAVLYCSGVDRPEITVSTAALDRLDDDELRAAVAHELEHIRRRDPATGWALMALRTLQAFNPATQIVGRQIVQELEHRSDRHAASLGLSAPLARVIAKLSSLEPTRTDLIDGPPPMPWVSGLSHRASAHAVSSRCARVLVPVEAPSGHPRTRLAAACAALGLVLFFVV